MLLGFQRMKAMAKHRSHSIEFKRQVAQEFIAGETLHSLARRHDVSRNDQPVNGCPSDGCGVESCYPSPPTTERLHSPLGPRFARRIQTVVATPERRRLRWALESEDHSGLDERHCRRQDGRQLRGELNSSDFGWGLRRE